MIFYYQPTYSTDWVKVLHPTRHKIGHFGGLGRFRYMTVSVQRGGQFRYMTTSVHMRSISAHVFRSTTSVHAKYRFGTSLSRYQYTASCLFILKVCKCQMDVWSVMLNFLCAVERSFSRSTSNIDHLRPIRERINVNKNWTNTSPLTSRFT